MAATAVHQAAAVVEVAAVPVAPTMAATVATADVAKSASGRGSRCRSK
jgi:hypothetical protein